MGKSTYQGATGILRDVMKKVVSGGTIFLRGWNREVENIAGIRYFWLGQGECARLKFGLIKIMEKP